MTVSVEEDEENPAKAGVSVGNPVSMVEVVMGDLLIQVPEW